VQPDPRHALLPRLLEAQRLDDEPGWAMPFLAWQAVLQLTWFTPDLQVLAAKLDAGSAEAAKGAALALDPCRVADLARSAAIWDHAACLVRDPATAADGIPF
jgi:hypothetical protein